jgi:hypothetical protein
MADSQELLKESLIQNITDFVTELVDQQFAQRKAIPELVSTHYLQFEQDYMKNYSDDEKVTHATIRHLLRWVYENQAAMSDPTDVITAIKFISPNIEALDNRTMAAVVQALIITGAGVLPTVNANPLLLPYETGFNINSDLVKGQLAWNETDNIWYIRIGDAVQDLREAFDLQIEHIEGLTQALIDAAAGGYTFADPLEVTAQEVSLKIDPATLEVDGSGRLAVKDSAGVLLSTIIPESFDNGNLVNNVLTIVHGKNTSNVKLYIRDAFGMDVTLPYDTSDPNQVVVDFGSPISGTWTYILEYWTNMSVGVYPDPNYSLSTHNHNGVYAPAIHSHSEYAAAVHNHDDLYPSKSHTHAGYAAASHDHNLLYEPKFIRGYIAPSYTGKNAALTVIAFNAYRDGNMMNVDFWITSSLAFPGTGSGAILATMPVGSRPVITRRFPGSIQNVEFYESAYGKIHIDGVITLFVGKANQQYIFNYSYPLA